MIGKHFIITGATSGLGFAISNELLQRGAHVTILEENVRNYYKEISLDQIKSARNRVKDIEYTQHLK